MGINVAVIPARGGSKGIPRKNVKYLAGKPLVAWSIEACLESEHVDKVIVSTEDPEIADISTKYGAEAYSRPKELAEDDIHSVHVILDYLSYCEKSGIIINRAAMIFPTSPLRTVDDINGAFNKFEECDCDSVISVCRYDKPASCLREGVGHLMRPIIDVECFEVQKQDIKNPLFEVNGSIYISTPEHLKITSSFHKGSVCPYVMSKTRSIDINYMDDFQIAEAILCQRQSGT